MSDNQLHSIEGVESYPSLQSLDLAGNRLGTVDLTFLTNLQFVNICSNPNALVTPPTSTPLQRDGMWANTEERLDINDEKCHEYDDESDYSCEESDEDGFLCGGYGCGGYVCGEWDDSDYMSEASDMM